MRQAFRRVLRFRAGGLAGHIRHWCVAGVPGAGYSSRRAIDTIGGILGGIGFGALSRHIGRRAVIVIAAVAALPLIPLWAFAASPFALGLGRSSCRSVCKAPGGHSGAPARAVAVEIRGTFPSVTYQLGNLLAAANATIQSAIASDIGRDYS